MNVKTLIYPISVNGQSYIPVEIKLPSQVERLTAITLTNTVNDGSTSSRLGTLCLQSNEKADIFLQEEIFQCGKGFNDPDDAVVQPFGADTHAAWLTGKIPHKLKISIDGSTGSLMGWYKSVYNTSAYMVFIYVEYRITEIKTQNNTGNGNRKNKKENKSHKTQKRDGEGEEKDNPNLKNEKIGEGENFRHEEEKENRNGKAETENAEEEDQEDGIVTQEF